MYIHVVNDMYMHVDRHTICNVLCVCLAIECLCFSIYPYKLLHDCTYIMIQLDWLLHVLYKCYAYSVHVLY